MNSEKDVLRQKTFSFSLKIIACCRHLVEDQKECILSRQLLKSGTAIGAMISEAKYAESIADFIHKMSIALKECSETIYWLELLSCSGIIKETKADLIGQCNEISYLLIATIKSSKKRIRK